MIHSQGCPKNESLKLGGAARSARVLP